VTPGWLLDTSAIAVSHHPRVLDQLSPMLRAGLLYTCPVLDIEALAAARSPEGYRVMVVERREAYRTVPLTAAIGERAMALQSRLSRRAHYQVVDANDLIVAATAIENDLTLLHYDRGFELLGQLSGLEQCPIVPLGSLSVN
jgi:predicted nucleic acid-binding protein